MLSTVPAASILGIKGFIVHVEADVAPGLPGFHVVGMPNTAVREAKKRVRAAVRNAGLNFPLQRITINLAPADHPKQGSHFDLSMAAAVLAATGQWCLPRERHLFIGELGLDGTVRPVRGVLPMALAAKEAGIRHLVLPAANAAEAAAVDGLTLHPMQRLDQGPVPSAAGDGGAAGKGRDQAPQQEHGAREYPCLTEIVGHARPKRALMLAAAGGHHLMMLGPPGVGKTLLARSLAGLLPPLSREEALEVSAIYSAAGVWDGRRGLIQRRPFRMPHPGITPSGLVGGGRWPAPGELSLAHLGVLFLDEAPAFGRERLDLLRTPLERGCLHLTRVQGSARLPCRISLVLAANPCPCGAYGDDRARCRCSAAQVARYQQRLSGPLLDRIDLQVEVERPCGPTQADGEAVGPAGATLRTRLRHARERQHRRASSLGLDAGTLNARVNGQLLADRPGLTAAARQLLDDAYRMLHLSMRSYHSTIRVAQTIMDLQAGEMDDWAPITADAVAEALQYRGFDRMLI